MTNLLQQILFPVPFLIIYVHQFELGYAVPCASLSVFWVQWGSWICDWLSQKDSNNTDAFWKSFKLQYFKLKTAWSSYTKKVKLTKKDAYGVLFSLYQHMLCIHWRLKSGQRGRGKNVEPSLFSDQNQLLKSPLGILPKLSISISCYCPLVLPNSPFKTCWGSGNTYENTLISYRSWNSLRLSPTSNLSCSVASWRKPIQLSITFICGERNWIITWYTVLFDY